MLLMFQRDLQNKCLLLVKIRNCRWLLLFQVFFHIRNAQHANLSTMT